MRKILYSILGIGLFMTSCTNFDDPVTSMETALPFP